MERLNLSALWTETRASFAANRGIYLTLGAAFILLPGLLFQVLTRDMVPAGSMRPPPDRLLPFALGVVAVVLLQFFAVLPVTRTVLAGGGVRVGDLLAEAARRIPVFLGAIVLLGLIGAVAGFVIGAALFGIGRVAGGASGARAAGVALVLVLLPVIIWVNARLLTLTPVIVAEGLGPWASIRRAWAMTRGHAGRLVQFLFVFLFVALVLSFVGGGLGAAVGSVFALLGAQAIGQAIALLIGGVISLFVGLWFAIFVAHVYRRLAGAGV